MTLSRRDQERYERLARLEEQTEGTPMNGSMTLRGDDAAAYGHQLLVEALGSEQAIDRAIGGRPKIGGTTDPGESPTIRVRVTPVHKQQISELKTRMHVKSESDVVRAALDEYVARHLRGA